MPSELKSLLVTVRERCRGINAMGREMGVGGSSVVAYFRDGILPGFDKVDILAKLSGESVERVRALLTQAHEERARRRRRNPPPRRGKALGILVAASLGVGGLTPLRAVDSVADNAQSPGHRVMEVREIIAESRYSGELRRRARRYRQLFGATRLSRAAA